MPAIDLRSGAARAAASVRRFEVAPGGCLSGSLSVPGDKSISHRAIMLSAIAEGTSRIVGFLESADCVATRAAFAAMGARYRRAGDALVIDGLGKHGLSPLAGAVNLGNSGTSMRLLCGLMAGQAFDSVLCGDASLSRRPMKRVIEPLRKMGAVIEAVDDERAPLRIRGGRSLRAIDYAPPIASAQIKSCVLLAGLYAQGTTRVNEIGVSRDHTERMLGAYGVEVACTADSVCVAGGQTLRACDVTIPSDLSSAAFFLVGASIAVDSEVTLAGVGVNPSRRGVIDILRAMGADIELRDARERAGEPVADLVVRSAALHGVDIGAVQVQRAIDEFPALFIAAACAKGVTRLRGAAELRVKESDRIAVMADGLARLGVAVETQADGLTITGKPQARSFTGGRLRSQGDHRVAMAFAMAGLRAGAPIVIDDCDNVDTSFPGFVDCAARAGLGISVRAAL